MLFIMEGWDSERDFRGYSPGRADSVGPSDMLGASWVNNGLLEVRNEVQALPSLR